MTRRVIKINVRCCSGCGATSLPKHTQKLGRTKIHKHTYDGPGAKGRHRLREDHGKKEKEDE